MIKTQRQPLAPFEAAQFPPRSRGFYGWCAYCYTPPTYMTRMGKRLVGLCTKHAEQYQHKGERHG